MSATLDAHRFCAYFGGGMGVVVEGRQHLVELLYVGQPEPDYLDAALITILQVGGNGISIAAFGHFLPLLNCRLTRALLDICQI